MIRSPFPVQRKPVPPAQFGDLAKMFQEVLRVYPEMQRMHQEMMSAKENTHAAIAKVKQGPAGLQGPPGLHAQAPSVQQVAAEVLKYIPKPKDGKNVPGEKGKDGKSVSVDEVLKELFSPERMDLQKVIEMRLDPHVQNLRRLVMRGGGDTVAAGSGVSISQSGGVKTISASVSLTVITVTGTVNDSNKTFTAASQPTLLNINGAFYQQTGGSYTWTYVAGTITLNQPVGTGGQIFGI